MKKVKVSEVLVIGIALVLTVSFVIWGYQDYRAIKKRRVKPVTPGTGVSYVFENKGGYVIYHYEILVEQPYDAVAYIQEVENKRLDEATERGQKPLKTSVEIEFVENNPGHYKRSVGNIQLSNYAYAGSEKKLIMTDRLQILYVPHEVYGNNEGEAVKRCLGLKDIQYLYESNSLHYEANNAGVVWTELWPGVHIIN